MNFASVVCALGALCACALAVASLIRRRRALSDYAFAGGMLGLSLEQALAWMSVRGQVSDRTLIAWQKDYLLAGALLTFFWLLFSLSYARGNARQFLSRWRFTL